MRNVYKGLLVVAALSAVAVMPAKAASLSSGGGWVQFDFGSYGSVQDDLSGDTDYNFTLTNTDVLRITDGYNTGDQFDVTINGVDQGLTTTPAVNSTDDGNCWSCAFWIDGAQYSHGEYILGPGVYDVSAIVTQSPYGAGAGAIELGAVPEPATWALMMVGFGGLGAMIRRSRRQVALATAA